MSLLERYRELYEYETDCDGKMLAMLESVPDASHSDARFQQALAIAGHLAKCRENWLSHMEGKGRSEAAREGEPYEIVALRPRFAAFERRWTDYFARLTEDQLGQEFEFTESNGESFRLPIEVQVEQLAGHAAYHRGQITLLVDQLGGDVVDTDYADWWWSKQEAL